MCFAVVGSCLLCTALCDSLFFQLREKPVISSARNIIEVSYLLIIVHTFGNLLFTCSGIHWDGKKGMSTIGITTDALFLLLNYMYCYRPSFMQMIFYIRKRPKFYLCVFAYLHAYSQSFNHSSTCSGFGFYISQAQWVELFDRGLCNSVQYSGNIHHSRCKFAKQNDSQDRFSSAPFLFLTLLLFKRHWYKDSIIP